MFPTIKTTRNEIHENIQIREYLREYAPSVDPDDPKSSFRICRIGCFDWFCMFCADVTGPSEIDGEVEDFALGSDAILDLFWFVIGNKIEEGVDT